MLTPLRNCLSFYSRTIMPILGLVVAVVVVIVVVIGRMYDADFFAIV